MSKFRSSVLGLTLMGALVLSAASANAADIYRGGGSLKDGPEYIPVQSWTGFYIGGNIGALFDAEVRVNGVSFTSDDSQLIGGVHAGYNFQSGGSPFVFGIEADVNFSEDISYLASIRGRVGYATPNALFYATGGVAFIELETPRAFGKDIEETGYVVGGGVEFKPASLGLSRNFSVGVEGLYYNFDLDDRRFGNNDVELDFFTVRARVSYHFNKEYEPLK